MFIQWQADVAVHHDGIDSDHQRMFELVNDLYDAMQTDAPRDSIGKTLQMLMACTREHFEHEDRVMQEHAYEHRSEHGRKHAALLAQLDTFVQEFDNGKTAITPETMDFLKEWLVQHIRRDDMKLAVFLEQAAGSDSLP